MTPLPRSWSTARQVAGLLAVVLMVLALPPAAASAATGTCTATPFRTNVSKRVVYRIPALVVTPRGTLLAFAERRRTTGAASDLEDTEIVLARSTDRGCHWSAPRVIADRGPDTVGNPSPVVDTTTGTVMLFTVDRPPGGTTYHGLHLQRSTDDGKTFTPYSKSGKDLVGIPRWHGGLTGPGHAIQLQSPNSPHRGRIVVPIGYRTGDRYGAYGIVSDDHGKSWKVGYDELGGDGRIEGTVAELADGRVWLSYHSRGAQPAVGAGRISAWSRNGGTTVDAPFARAGLPVVSVQGSALGLTGRYAGTMLFSSPAGKDKATRRQMALFVSRGAGAGKTWSAPYDVVLDNRPASYSDLAQLDDTTIGLLYETGQSSWHERIEYRSLRIADVVNAAPVTPTLSVAAPNPLATGRTLKATLAIRVPSAGSPAGEFRVRLRGPGVDRSQTLRLYGDSKGRRVVTLGTLRKGTYKLEVSYVGPARIKGRSTTRTITAR